MNVSSRMKVFSTVLVVLPLLVSPVSTQNLCWEAFWGGSGFDVATAVAFDTVAVAQDNLANIYVTGTRAPGPFGGYDAFIASFDRFGVLRWETFWGTRTRYDTASALVVDDYGNLYIAGVTSPGQFGLFDVFVASFNSSGGFRWEAFWGTSGYEWASGVAVDLVGNVYVTGRTSDVYYPGPWNAFLVSFNSSGGFRWEAFWGLPVREVAYGVALDPLGNAYITGYVSPGPVGGEDAFVVSFDRFGVFRWEAFWGRQGNDRAFGVAFNLGNVYIAGWTNPGPLGGYDAFIAAFATQPINATVDIEPEKLSMRSNKDFVTAYIELPPSYNVQDILLETVRLEGIEAITDSTYGFVKNPKAYLSDRNKNGILERMVKFDRQTLIEHLETQGISGGEVTLAITGKVGEQSFEGKDTIIITNG